jgi:sortase A
MSIGKKFTAFLLTLAMLCGGTVSAYDTLGQITLTLRDGDTLVQGGSLELHRVGDLDAQESLTLNADFAAVTQKRRLDLESPDLAEALADHAESADLPGTVAPVSDQGTVTFSDLEEGVYLVMQADAFGNSGDISPFLVAIPQQVDGQPCYDVDASPKVQLLSETDPEVSPETSPETSQEPTVSPAASPKPVTSPSPSATSTGNTLPKTGQLNWPIPLLVLLGIAVFLAGKRRERLSRLCLCLGSVMILAALGLFSWNRWTDSQAGVTSQEALVQVKAQLPEETPQDTPAWEQPQILFLEDSDTQADTAMPEVEIDGRLYIGYLSIPALEIELPVQSQWSYDNLAASPCRYAGSLQTRDLVIAAHNYTAHFGEISHLLPGDPVYFTDMNGKIYSYVVEEIDTLPPTAVAEMTDGEYDLTLFTCTYGGKSRVTVRCMEASEA